MTISPKEDFLDDKTMFGMEMRADIHAATVANPLFKRACETALLEYTTRLNCEDPRAALKLHGARSVIDILLNLSDRNIEPRSESDLKPLTPV